MQKPYEFSPLDLFMPERMDLVVKYLYAKDILRPFRQEAYRSLYFRHIMMRTGMEEPLAPMWPLPADKSSLQDYDDSFQELLNDMQRNGFRRNSFIPFTPHNFLIAGAHRLAAAAALGIGAYGKVEHTDPATLWDFEWFTRNGFDLDDRMRILKGYVDLFPHNCSVILAWPPVMEYLEHIRQLIGRRLDLVGEVCFCFEDNSPAFSHLLYDLYCVGKMGQVDGADAISRKIDLFRAHELACTAILVTNRRSCPDLNIFTVVAELKGEIRQSFGFALPPELFATLHASSDAEETRHMARVLFSPNNHKYLRLRLLQDFDRHFINLCETAREALRAENIPLEEACVVGSGVMGALGIAQPGDLDFIVTSRVRERYGDGPVKLRPSVDLEQKGYALRNEEGVAVDDDTLIECDDCHFIFNGIKFANIDIVKSRKKLAAKNNDLNHVRQIQLFENLTGHFDSKRIIKERVLQEALKRKLHIRIMNDPNTRLDTPVYVTKSVLPDLATYMGYVEKIFQSGIMTNHGQFVAGLEKRLAAELLAPNMALCANGTMALLLAIRAAGLSGQEVVTTPFSYVATVNTLLWEGCTPVFADIDEETLCMDPEQLSQKITSQTRGVLPVHVYGNACDVDAIKAIALKYDLRVVYDAAHCFGASYQGRSLLSFGDYSACSFHATKLFHTVEGGCVVSSSPESGGNISLLRAFGHINDAYHTIGINAKMSELHAAVGLSLIDMVPEIIRSRREVCLIYDALLPQHGLRRPAGRPGQSRNYSYYPVIFDDEKTLLRVCAALNEQKIFPRRYFYPALNTLPHMPSYQPCPVAESISPRVLCLPLHSGLETPVVERIAQIIAKVLA